ncbi:MAG: S8/S53 family peptidase [Rhodothermia bacterium]
MMRGITVLFALSATLSIGGAHVSRAQSKSTEVNVKYWISFVDKDNGAGKGPAVVEPGFVSERALRRRELRAETVEPNMDIPVSSFYQNELRAMGVEPIMESRWLNAVSAFLSPDQVEAVSELNFVRSISAVAQSVDMSAPPQSVVLASSAPSVADASGAYLLDYGASRTQLESINAIVPIEEGFIGEGVLLGFLDTTTDTLHPALKHLVDSGRIVKTRDFTVESGLEPQTNKHGLWTSSTAFGFDEGNLIGACYGAEYILATTEYAPFERNQEEDFFVAGMEWMERMGADIVNVSLGYSTFDAGQDSYTYEDMDGKTAKTTIASDMAVGLGVVVVSSAGNQGCNSPNSCWFYISSPADGFGVIAAGAVDAAGNLVGFSGRGPSFDGRFKPDLAAMGTGVRFASGRSGYSTFGAGTSFSAPLISSVACQVLQANPSLNPNDVRNILRSTASQAANPDNEKGWGVVDAEAAVNLAKVAVTSTERDPSVPDGRASLTVYPNPAVDRAIVGLGVEQSEQSFEVALYDILGRRVGIAENGASASGFRTFNLDLSGLSPGLYLVRAQGSDLELVQSLIVR